MRQPLLFTFLLITLASTACGDSRKAPSAAAAASQPAVALSAEDEPERKLRGSIVDAIKAYVSSEFKDPDSAKFLDVQLYTSSMELVSATKGPSLHTISYAVCGKVNAKNSYGAYVGYRQFFGHVVLLKNKDPQITSLIDSSSEPHGQKRFAEQREKACKNEIVKG